MSEGSHHRIGFISTRFAGTDGVSLETAKWATCLTGLGHECFYFAGELDRPADRAYLVDSAHFQHPEILSLTADLFDDTQRAAETTKRVHVHKDHIKDHLYKFIKRFELELIIIENALSVPMNVPLGLAITELIAETCIPAIGHHHDFAWERSRFFVHAASDYLRAAFPPVLPSLRHVVINSEAGMQLSLRTGASSSLIPNVMDFETEPPPPDRYTEDLRDRLGIKNDVKFLLQPTRVVPRKSIERAIELVRRMDCPCVLVITHSAGDEGSEYEIYLKEFAGLLGVQVLFAAGLFGYYRDQSPEGEKIYSLQDAYQLIPPRSRALAMHFWKRSIIAGLSWSTHTQFSGQTFNRRALMSSHLTTSSIRKRLSAPAQFSKMTLRPFRLRRTILNSAGAITLFRLLKVGLWRWFKNV